MYNYTAFSLRIQSELFFPALVDAEASQAHDVSICFGFVPAEGLLDVQSGGLYYHVKPNAFWLHVPGVARFLVTDGNQITIEPVTGVDEERLRVFLLAPCWGALLMQRDLFVLQGTVLKSGDHAMALLGHPGSGKSTVAAALLKKKYGLLSNEMCVMNHQLEVIPGHSQMNRWRQLPWFRKIWPGVEEHGVTHPLKRLFILNPSKHHQHIQATPLLGGNKISRLQQYSYNKTYVTGLGQDALYFNCAAKLASKMEVILIDWPVNGCRGKDVANFMEQMMREVEHAV